VRSELRVLLAFRAELDPVMQTEPNFGCIDHRPALAAAGALLKRAIGNAPWTHGGHGADCTRSFNSSCLILRIETRGLRIDVPNLRRSDDFPLGIARGDDLALGDVARANPLAGYWTPEAEGEQEGARNPP